jgi:glycosyltransferase involved in cell wall biosynthesis
MVLVGGGPQARALRGRIHRLGLGDRVHLLGKLPFRELCALYASADVVVFPSFWEGQGLVPGEAMASGTPCVAAEVGWVPEIIEQGLNGFHYPPRDVARGAELLAKVLEDDALREGMGRRARQDVLDRWEWKHHMAKLERLYEEVQGDQKPPRGA